MISLMRFMISLADVGVACRISGLIWTTTTSSVVVVPKNGKITGLAR